MIELIQRRSDVVGGVDLSNAGAGGVGSYTDFCSSHLVKLRHGLLDISSKIRYYDI